ncbi:MAG: glycosyltransferase family 4 protein [Bacteroidales bacterium]|jgi:glycosyltransferase involved in cell wall biosynthesis|nr:glycosyltransferase family 4 protein [Bacteroidales bacterium]
MATENKIKLLFVSTLNSVGGHEVLWFETAKIALAKGYQVGICVYENKFSAQRLRPLLHYPNLHLFYKKPLSEWQEVFNRFFNTEFKFISINKRAIKWQPDLTLFTGGTNLPLGNDIKLFAKKDLRFCFVGHNGNDLLWLSDSQSKSLKEVFAKSAMNYFVSQANLNLARMQVISRIDNAEIVRNPFNVAYDNNIPFPDDKCLHFAQVGTYDFEAKGQDILLQVLSLPKWRERNVEINFYGSGVHKNRLKETIKMLGLANVNVCGFCKTEDIWRHNHVLLMPSRHEGLPMAIVEAMLCGRVVVATAVSGNPEVIDDNVTGFLAQSPAVKCFDEAMEKLWQRRIELQSIGQAARNGIKKLVPPNPAEVFLNKLLSNIDCRTDISS